MFPLLSLLYFYVFPMSILSDENYKHDLDYGPQGSLVAVREWREGIKLGVWNGSVNKKLEELEYNEVSEEKSILSTRPTRLVSLVTITFLYIW